MLRDRVFSGILLLALVLVVIAFGGPLLVLALGVAAVIGLLEFYNMARKGGYTPWLAGGLILTLLLLVEAALRYYDWNGPGLAVPLTLVVLLGALLVGASDGQPPLAAWANAGLTVGGALYIGGLLRLG